MDSNRALERERVGSVIALTVLERDRAYLGLRIQTHFGMGELAHAAARVAEYRAAPGPV
jgi:hypothetical protein